MSARKKTFTRKRPVALTITAAAIVVLFLVRLYQFFAPLIQSGFFKEGATAPLWQGWWFTSSGSLIFLSFSYLLLSLAGIVVLIGYLRLRRWSWVLLMIWTGGSLFISLLDYFFSHPNYIVMASNVIIAFALNIKTVRDLFGIGSVDGHPA
jgi:hypothetical protein